MVPAYTKVPTITRVVSGSNLYQSLKMQNSTAADVSSPRELRIPVPWGHIAAKAWGPTSGSRRILGIHGWLDNAGTFEKLVPKLPSNVQFVAFDLSGHGLSSHLPSFCRYSYIDWVMDIRRTVQHLEWKDNLILIGHSMGAGVALLFGGIFPDMVKKIVCLDHINALPLPVSMFPSTFNMMYDEHLAQPSEEELQPKVMTMDEAVHRLRKSFNNNITEESARIVLRRGVTHVSEKLVYPNRDSKLKKFQNFGCMSSEELSVYIGNVTSDVLVLRTSLGFNNSALTKPCFDIRPIKARSFKMVDVEGGHHLHLDEPDKVLKHINPFLGF